MNRCQYCSKTFTHAPARLQHERSHACADELHHLNDTQAGGREKLTGEDKNGGKGGGIASGGSGKGVGNGCGGDVAYRCMYANTAARLLPDIFQGSTQ